MLAYDFPILGLFWTMLILFIWIAWLMVLFRTVLDIFRSDDMGGISKAIWLLFVIAIPWLGVLVYLIARGSKMQARDIKAAQEHEQAVQDYIRQTAGPKGTAEELTKLADLRDRGVISAAEFDDQKAKLLS
jgi:hypothetical protein